MELASAPFSDVITDTSPGKKAAGFPFDLNPSENRYYQLFNSIDQGYCVIDVLFDSHDKPSDYRFLEVNAAFEWQTGLANATGKCVTEVAPALERYWFDTYGQIALTGEPLRFQQWASGFNRYYDVYAFRIGKPEDRQVAILFNDITEKKRAQNNLSFLFDITQSLASVHDMEEAIQVVGLRMGNFLFLSCFLFAKISKQTNDIEVLHNWRLPNIPDMNRLCKQDEYFTDQMQTSLQEGDCIIVTDIAIDDRVQAKNFQQLPIRSFVAVPLRQNEECRYLICLCRQETSQWRGDEVSLMREATTNLWTTLEKKRIERDLYHSEERLRVALEAGNIGICDLDFKTLQTVCNPVRYAMYGMEASEQLVAAEEFLARTHPDDVKKLRQNITESIKAEGKYKEEFRILHPDGTVRWIAETGQVTEWENGKPLRLISTLLDITQRKMDEQLRNDFFSIASHELRTPVTNLKAIAFLMKDRFEETKDDYAEELRVQFEKQADRLNRLILNMLDASKAVIGKLDYQMGTIDVLSLLREVVHDLQCISGSHRLILSSPPLPNLFADAERLTQVFSNIISNAIKYSPATPDEELKEICIDVSYTDTELTITVSDTGIGMSAGTVERLFQRFFRSDTPETHKYPGSGLGLFISKEIMQYHGGSISVQSEKGNGSVFTLTLPVSAILLS